MRYGSVCSGIEAASVAWKPLGWRCAFVSEIEAFPCAVLEHRFPGVPNLGDMTRFKEWPDHAIDLLAGGTPCQSFSVAGLRKGLDDPRGDLMLVFLALARRYRPKWVVWENVPGVLSSNEGRDFAAFLRGLGECGYGFAYRTLDAQYFGVPQRRRRVFVVGYLGDWRPAAAVLLEPESLRGDPAPRREAGEGVAAGAAIGVALRGRDGGGTAELTGDVATALRASQGGGDKPHVAHALRGEGFDASEDGTGRGTPPVHAFDARQSDVIQYGDMAGPIDTDGHTQAIAFTCKDHGADAGGQGAVAFHENQRAEVTVADTAGSLKVGGGKPGQGYPAVAQGMAVRRLTPRECERLQGFPDDWTLIPYRGKPAAQCPDGPRYKALGNSMAVPVMRWIGGRIDLFEREVRPAIAGAAA